MLEILDVEPFGRDELLAGLRRTRLDGLGQAPVYEHARLDLVAGTDPERLAPAQRYLLRPNVATVLDLRRALLGHGIDVLALDGGVRIRTSANPSEAIPVLPPIVEESREPGGRSVLIVADGLHRVQAARRLGVPVTVVEVRDLPARFPYYAYALAGGWSEVVELDDLPDGFAKKPYRDPANHRALFRRYDDVFPGVQKARKDCDPRRQPGRSRAAR